jgi:hypothetical protein
LGGCTIFWFSKCTIFLMFLRETTYQTAPDGDEDTTAKDWKTWPDYWSPLARKDTVNGWNAHDDKTPLWAWKRGWTWLQLNWCDTWPFEKTGNVSQQQQGIILILISKSDLIFKHFFFYRKSERLWSLYGQR